LKFLGCYRSKLNFISGSNSFLYEILDDCVFILSYVFQAFEWI
jgi:hypothetical protein